MPKRTPKQPPLDIHGWTPMPVCCPSCPFGPEGDVELANRIRGELLQASQICHHPRLHGSPETRLCRGARDEQLRWLHRLGFLEEPTDRCFAQVSAAARERSRP